MAAIDYSERIPNNVGLADNRRLQRALEEWQPKFIEWWMEMGPHGFQAKETYLRTAVSVDAQGWAQFDYVRMPEYRWGLFLAEPEPGRTIGFGDHMPLKTTSSASRVFCRCVRNSLSMYAPSARRSIVSGTTVDDRSRFDAAKPSFTC